jgi:hypothetical protein
MLLVEVISVDGERLRDALSHFYGQEDIDPFDVLRATVAVYNAETGDALDAGALTEEQRERLRDSLNELEREGPTGPILRFGKQVRAHLPLYPDMAEKISWLSQLPCSVCSYASPIDHFPIEIPPWSHQSARHVGPCPKASNRG